jgi:hypothetical protein
MNKYTIEPMNEPNGEGNGWDHCAEDEATIFVVCENATDDDQGAVEDFDTMAEAVEFVKRLEANAA